MKKLIMLMALTCSVCSINAQSAKYAGAMKANINAIDSSFRSPLSLLALSNNFERIANAEKTQWQPYYYAALLQINYGFMEQDKSKTDQIADKAAELVSKADSLSPGNSEVSVLKSMVATCRLMVDPMKRFMQYGAESNAELENAIREDATNPRPYFLRAQSLKYTPEQFGGGCGPAMEQLSIAFSKFSTFKPASDLHPAWGLSNAKRLAEECK